MTPTKWLIAAVIAIAALAGLYFVTKDDTSSTSTISSTPTGEVVNRPTVNTTKTHTAAEVAQHDTEADCWTIINGNVYDLTSFIGEHPGGDEILRACGIDGSSLFNSRETTEGEAVGSGTPHSSDAQDNLSELQVGVLAN